MNKKVIAVAIAIVASVATTEACAFGGWLGKQIDNLSDSATDGNNRPELTKEQIIAHESMIQGQIRPIPGQNYRITKTTMTILRKQGKLVNIDPPTGERYVIIVDDDPSVSHYQAYSVNCDTYGYRMAPDTTTYRKARGEYGGAVAYAACNIPLGM